MHRYIYNIHLIWDTESHFSSLIHRAMRTAALSRFVALQLAIVNE